MEKVVKGHIQKGAMPLKSWYPACCIELTCMKLTQPGDSKKPLIEMMASHFYADSLNPSKGEVRTMHAGNSFCILHSESLILHAGNQDKTHKKKSRVEKKSSKDHSKSTQEPRKAFKQ